jgi:hypothetical protein
VQIDEVREGYYKVRLRAKGPWVPLHLWLEDGERDPETWELLSDQKWRCEWAPRLDSPQLFRIRNPFAFVNRGYPISKDEFQWLLILRTMRSRPQSRKRSSK